MDFNINSPLATYGSVMMRIPPLFIMDEILKINFGLSAGPYIPRRLYAVDDEDDGADTTSDLPAVYEDNANMEYRSDFVKFINMLDAKNFNNDNFKHIDNTSGNYYKISKNDSSHVPSFEPFLGTSLLPLFLRILFFVLSFMGCGVWASLNWPHLLSLYSVIGSLGCVVLSYQCNVAAVQQFVTASEQHPPLLHTLLSLDITGIMHNSTPVLALGCNYVAQAFLFLAFIFMQVDQDNISFIKGLVIWTFMLPSCSMLVTFSKDVTLNFTMLCAFVPLAMTKWRIIKGIPYAFSVIVGGVKYSQNVINNVNIHTLFELEWTRLNIPNVLRVFWIIRVANFIVYSIANELHTLCSHNIIALIEPNILYKIFKYTMTYGCDTVLALLGMTSMVSSVAHYIGVFFQALLLTEDDRSIGTVSAILFFVLAEQSGLTVLENEKRYVRLCRNFCLLFTAMLYFVHNMVNPVLMSLSASRNRSFYRHVRALCVCAMLLFLPAVLLVVLWSVFSLSTWLLAVSAFSVQVVIKTLVTVLIYLIFLGDAHYSIFWDNLDDYVYYIKAVGNSIEFLFGIILFFNGLWIYFFESGGAIRALMMCVHAYVNIWCEARNGWSAFMKRRTAVYKMAFIPDATPQQLADHDDVCTICFQDLTSAKITKCKHFYHEVCLRKWLYVQDTCPLCHATLHVHDTQATKTNTLNDPNIVGLGEIAGHDDTGEAPRRSPIGSPTRQAPDNAAREVRTDETVPPAVSPVDETITLAVSPVDKNIPLPASPVDENIPPAVSPLDETVPSPTHSSPKLEQRTPFT